MASSLNEPFNVLLTLLKFDFISSFNSLSNFGFQSLRKRGTSNSLLDNLKTRFWVSFGFNLIFKTVLDSNFVQKCFFCLKQGQIQMKFFWTQIACKVGLHITGLYSRMSFIYRYNTSTLTPFVKPCIILNLALQNVFYVQLYMESTFTYNPGLT